MISKIVIFGKIIEVIHKEQEQGEHVCHYVHSNINQFKRWEKNTTKQLPVQNKGLHSLTSLSQNSLQMYNISHPKKPLKTPFPPDFLNERTRYIVCW